MDFSLSAEQEELQRSAIDFAQKELNEGLVRRDESYEFSRAAWKACAKFGVQGLPIPRKYGGGEADIVSTVAVMEGLGYGCRDNGLLFSLNAQLWSVEMPLIKFGTEAQKKKFLPSLLSGDLIGTHCMTEPDSGSDAFSLRTKFDKIGDNYVLNGSKLYATNSPIAGIALVFATSKPGQGFSGATAFLVERDTSGFETSTPMHKMGLHTSPIGEVILRDCEIPAYNLLGKVGGGMSIFNSSMEWERSCILATSLGAMRRQLEACLRYANTRKQFGKPIGKFQSVSNMIADMYLRLEAARLLTYKVAWLKQQGHSAVLEAAAAKLFTSEAWVKSSLDAIQIHGAFGYMTDSEVERDLRDAVAGTIYSGTSEIQRLLIANSLGL